MSDGSYIELTVCEPHGTRHTIRFDSNAFKLFPPARPARILHRPTLTAAVKMLTEHMIAQLVARSGWQSEDS